MGTLCYVIDRERKQAFNLWKRWLPVDRYTPDELEEVIASELAHPAGWIDEETAAALRGWMRRRGAVEVVFEGQFDDVADCDGVCPTPWEYGVDGWVVDDHHVLCPMPPPRPVRPPVAPPPRDLELRGRAADWPAW